MLRTTRMIARGRTQREVTNTRIRATMVDGVEEVLRSEADK